MKYMEHTEKGNATNRTQMMSLKAKDISLSFMENFTSAYEIFFFSIKILQLSVNKINSFVSLSERKK